MRVLKLLSIAAISFLLASCSKGSVNGGEDPIPSNPPTEKIPIKLSVGLSTRVTDNAFENGDEIGLYMVNYNGTTPGTLANSGNYLNNTKFTYNGNWSSATPLYWKDNTTHADFYVYYPYGSPSNVSAYTFNVKANQSNETDYKASDFIWGKKENVAPTESYVNIQTSHLMSCIVIKLAAGEGLTEEEVTNGDATISINAIKTSASINLANGEITVSGDTGSVTPCKSGAEWRAIIAPQEVPEQNLITVTLNGAGYNLKKGFTFVKGKKHTFTITLSKGSSGLNVDITDWEDDGTDNGGIAQ